MASRRLPGRPVSCLNDPVLTFNESAVENRTTGRTGVSSGPFDAMPGTGSSDESLLERAKAGDREAQNALFARHAPALRRWASGRLPRWARDVADTPDLVQDTLLQTFKKLNGFEPRGEGALQAYLRQAVMNRIRDELRRADRKPDVESLGSGAPDQGLSPLEQAIGTEAVERYEKALARLRDDERELVIGRVELGLTYQELADACGRPSVDAARMAVGRALVRLAEEMRGSTGTR